MRMLVIDDEPMIRSVVAAAFAGTADTLEASDGPAGLAFLEGDLVDVVLLDVMMPGMSGYEVLARIRRDSRFAGLPVVMLTAKTGETDRVTAYRSGADGYLTKPFDIVELVDAVTGVARRGSVSRTAVREAELSRAELLRQIERQFDS